MGEPSWRIRGGGVVGREGDVIQGLGGGVGNDGAFYICPFGIPTER